MKISNKIRKKDCKMTINIKLSSDDEINSKELDFFTGKCPRGFLVPSSYKRNTIKYTGPISISLYKKLKKPITKYDFFFIIEQLVDVTQKIKDKNLFLTKLILDLKNVYINETTKEVQFIYVPIASCSSDADIISFIKSVIYSAKPSVEDDMDYISRFVYFINSLNGYDPDRVERFIAQECKAAVNIIKRHRAEQLRSATDKSESREEYSNCSDDEATGLIGDDDEDTQMLNGDEDTGLLSGYYDSTDDEATEFIKKICPTLRRVSTDEIISIDKPVFRIGKDKRYVDYYVTDNNSVSRSHADIITRGSRYFVIDLGSKNKTFINNKIIPVQTEVEILDGNKLKLASEEFTFNIDSKKN